MSAWTPNIVQMFAFLYINSLLKMASVCTEWGHGPHGPSAPALQAAHEILPNII